MKDSKSRRGLNLTLVLSLAANVVLLAGIGLMESKTHFFQKTGNRLELCELSPEKRGDYWCIRGWTNTLKKLEYDADVVLLEVHRLLGGVFKSIFRM